MSSPLPNKPAPFIVPYGSTLTNETKSPASDNLPQKKACLSFYAHHLSKIGGSHYQQKVNEIRAQIKTIRDESPNIEDRKIDPELASVVMSQKGLNGNHS